MATQMVQSSPEWKAADRGWLARQCLGFGHQIPGHPLARGEFGFVHGHDTVIENCFSRRGHWRSRSTLRRNPDASYSVLLLCLATSGYKPALRTRLTVHRWLVLSAKSTPMEDVPGNRNNSALCRQPKSQNFCTTHAQVEGALCRCTKQAGRSSRLSSRSKL